MESASSALQISSRSFVGKLMGIEKKNELEFQKLEQMKFTELTFLIIIS